MRAKILSVGSWGWIKISRSVIQRCGFGEEVELTVRRGELVIKPAKSPLAGWESAFATMRGHGHDALLDPETVNRSTEWEEAGWRW